MQIHDVAGYHVRGFIQGLLALEMNVAEILGSVGIRSHAFDDPEARLSEPLMMQLWLAAESRFHGELFSLQVAMRVPFGALELIDYVVLGCPTLGEGIANLAHHAELCASGFFYRVEPASRDGEGGMLVRLDHRYGLALLPRGAIEYAWALLLTRFRSHLDARFLPNLQLRQVPRGPLHLYRQALGDVSFESEQDALFVPKSQWSLVNPRRDPMLATLIERHAHDVSRRMPRNEDFSQSVENAVADALRAGDPSIEQVARRLALGSRTLQRKLTESGEVYRQLVERVRRHFAERCLSSTQLSLAEIGYLLAYSDPSAFNRAFRRWAGMTPAEYRLLHSPGQVQPPAATDAPGVRRTA